MTLIASFIGVDCKFPTPKPSSIYIVADSRVTWGSGKNFDFARKVFGCKNHPDIFGYCGDVLFPSIVLNQIVEIADQGLLFNDTNTCQQKSWKVYDMLKASFEKYPNELSTVDKTIQIIHASRDSAQNFFCRTITWYRSTNKWEHSDMVYNGYSDKLFVLGTGSKEFTNKFEYYKISENQKTSRAVFHCFVDALDNIKDKHCGGAPQLVGLYRIKNAQFFGIIHKNKRYLHGMQVDDLKNLNNIEWRNELFEVCDGETMLIKAKAKKQPNPLR